MVNIKKDLLNLGMESPVLKFEILEKNELSANGMDAVNLLFSSNQGHELKPLIDIGSGGEIARLMLCVKKYLFGVNKFSTIIFDEIDKSIISKTYFESVELNSLRRIVISAGLISYKELNINFSSLNLIAS